MKKKQEIFFFFFFKELNKMWQLQNLNNPNNITETDRIQLFKKILSENKVEDILSTTTRFITFNLLNPTKITRTITIVFPKKYFKNSFWLGDDKWGITLGVIKLNKNGFYKSLTSDLKNYIFQKQKQKKQQQQKSLREQDQQRNKNRKAVNQEVQKVINQFKTQQEQRKKRKNVIQELKRNSLAMSPVVNFSIVEPSAPPLPQQQQQQKQTSTKSKLKSVKQQASPRTHS